MKKLYLIRHAKSSWDQPLSDHDRPLSNRGFNDADIISKALFEKKIIVDHVFSSTANRAKTTSMIITETLKIAPKNIDYLGELYDFNGSTVIDTIKNISDDFKSIIVFGHNPAFTVVANTLGSEYFTNIPTCGVVCIEFDCDKWNQVEDGKTIFHLFPKELK